MRATIKTPGEIPMSSNVWNRRAVLQSLAAGAVAIPHHHADEPTKAKCNIKQSVCRWCYGKIPLDKLAGDAAKIGYKSVELLNPDEFKVVKQAGLTCAVIRCASIADGLNRKE